MFFLRWTIDRWTVRVRRRELLFLEDERVARVFVRRLAYRARSTVRCLHVRGAIECEAVDRVDGITVGALKVGRVASVA